MALVCVRLCKCVCDHSLWLKLLAQGFQTLPDACFLYIPLFIHGVHGPPLGSGAICLRGPCRRQLSGRGDGRSSLRAVRRTALHAQSTRRTTIQPPRAAHDEEVVCWRWSCIMIRAPPALECSLPEHLRKASIQGSQITDHSVIVYMYM